MSRLVISAVVALAVCVSTATARDMTGEYELSVAGSFQAHVMKSETFHLFNVPLRVGYFFNEYVELEAEGILSVMDEQLSGDDGLSVIGSALLSVNIPNESQIMPFALVGYGVTNSHAYASFQTSPLWSDVTLGVFNLGAGGKFFFGESGALRVEYRMQSCVGGPGKNSPKYSEIYDCTSHSLYVGASLFPF